MAKRSGLGAAFFYRGYDLSGDVGSLQNIGGGPTPLEVSGIDKYAFERIGGLRDGRLSFNSWFNDAVDQEHEILKLLLENDGLGTFLAYSGISAPCANIIAKQINYDWNRGANGELATSIELLGNGYGLMWSEALTAGKVTTSAATNGTPVDGGRRSEAVSITSSSVASPTVITTATPNGRQTGDSVEIAGHAGSTPALDGNYTVTVLTPTTFTVPVNVTVGGTGGSMYATSTRYGAALAVHLFGIDTGSVTVKLQDSPDGVTFADLAGLSIGPMTAAERGAALILPATNLIIQRFIRAVLSGTFTNATLFASAHRPSSASFLP